MNENDNRYIPDDTPIGDDNESLLRRHRAAAPQSGQPGQPQRPAQPRPTQPRPTQSRPSQPRPSQPRPTQARPPQSQRRTPPPAEERRSPVGQAPAPGTAQPRRPDVRASGGVNPQTAKPSASAGAAPTPPARTPQPAPRRPAAPGQAMPVPRENPGAPAVRRRPASPVLPESKAVGPAAQPAEPVPAYNARRQTGTEAQPTPSAPTPGAKKKKKKPEVKTGTDMMVSIVKAITYMVLVLVVAVFISIFVIRVGNDVFAFVKSDEAVEITIPEDATASDIATILYDEGIIRYPSIFKLYASLKHDTDGFVAGNYTVQPAMSYDDLRGSFHDQIATGTSWITIPEGCTTDEIIDLLVTNKIGERDKYIDVINNYDFDYWFVDELEQNGIPAGRLYRLDGYLFPDTYEFYNSSSEETVINRMLSRFEEVYVEAYRTKAAELGMSVDEIVNLAALIEKEGTSAADYMYVSSVFQNRLSNPGVFPNLQSDATLVYAIQAGTGVRPESVSADDKNYDNPYNTYMYKGLPPGPITNPSASAIRYALYPADTNYYYFVTADSGTIYYASSLAEHNANIEAVKSQNSDE